MCTILRQRCLNHQDHWEDSMKVMKLQPNIADHDWVRVFAEEFLTHIFVWVRIEYTNY